MSEELLNATSVDLFPINALRNVALLAARTELVLIGDGENFTPHKPGNFQESVQPRERPFQNKR